ncbi:MAG TPA: ATP-binding protein [Acidimicrobiales bacterium]|nr:ATP-binding protein [Acidimicrobiales bacterium]
MTHSDPSPPGPGTGPSAAERLLSRLASVEWEVAAAVERRHGRVASDNGNEPDGAEPDGAGANGEAGRGQGLFISPADVAALLAPGARTSGGRKTGGGLLASCDGPGPDPSAEDRSVVLRQIFGLAAVDLAILLVALAPDVDPRYESLYAYLNDDVTCRRPTVGLCLELCGLSLAQPSGRARFRSDAPLLRHRLLEIDDTRPFPSRTLKVPDRVVDHLLGGDLPDTAVDPLLLPPLMVLPPYADLVEAAVEHGVHLLYLRSPRGPVDHAGAAGALASLGFAVVQVDVSRIRSADDAVEVAAAISREAGLRRSALVAGPIDEIPGVGHRTVAMLAGSPGPVVLLGSGAWEPGWSDVSPMILDVDTVDFAAAAQVWREVLADGDPPADLLAATATYRLTPHQALRATEAAVAHAAARGGTVDVEALRAGARAQNGGGLEALARRVSPRAGVDDLILSEPASGQVLETVTRARLRHQVVGEWQMRGVGSHGNGITALFAGASGTGKTLAAEVIAGSLGLDLYVVDLSSVVDKYVGETEKNLERIFNGAQGLNGVLFFDEADALFGKRSAVSDGHDRYANIEVAFLLQRMEQFDGISVLATNLTANLDDAFARRIDIRVVFPQPEAPERRRLWARHLPPSLPVTDDIDLDLLARSFRLAGGDIRNVTLAAAYDAASRQEPVGMAHLVRATAREYRKLGRLCTAEDFGPYMSLIGT